MTIHKAQETPTTTDPRTSHEATQVLTNRTAATRLRTLMSQLTHEPPPSLSTRLIKRLTPTPEKEHHLLSFPHNNHEEETAA
jgi:hypothetical protein